MPAFRVLNDNKTKTFFSSQNISNNIEFSNTNLRNNNKTLTPLITNRETLKKGAKASFLKVGKIHEESNNL